MALGLSEDGGNAATRARVLAHLRHKRLLLLLDNFEHLLAGAQQINEILAAAASLKIIVTSRAALHLQAEYEYEVRPLALPQQTQTPMELLLVPSVALFVARAQARNPRFKLDAGNAEAIRQICLYSDGLPLVLELMSARTRLLSPLELAREMGAARLPMTLVLDSLGARDTPERHRTLERAIAWSYDLLSPEEQTLLNRLSVFVGRFTLEAAKAVCGATLIDIESLVDHSFVRTCVEADPDLDLYFDLDTDQSSSVSTSEPASRFSLLESIRLFALNRLRASNQAHDVCLRHAQYLLSVATYETSAGLNPATDLDSGDFNPTRLLNDLNNVRAALRFTLASKDDVLLGLQLTIRMMYWFWGHGYHAGAGVLGAAGAGPDRAELDAARLPDGIQYPS
ncbi:MAG: hypothetical protein HC853_00665 [Anaerolineae bacterium]|nr:hypothetical protein [Anaerolineae bacterium]